MEALNKEEIERKTAELANGWQYANERLMIIVQTENFVSAVDMVNKIADIAEEMGHHPDLKIFDYKNLEISIFNHELEGITEEDFEPAGRIQKEVL